MVPIGGMGDEKRKPRVSITLEGEILKEIDRNRGLVPRSAWINDILKRSIGEEATL